MNSKLALFVGGIVLLAASGCSTVDSRVAAHRAQFDSWPPPIQQAVSAGRIGIGFTMEQVRVALGEPDHAFSRTSAAGTYQIWSFRDRRPRFAFGIGVGSFNGNTAVGTGVSATTGGYRGERTRVIFDATGHVSQIEEITR